MSETKDGGMSDDPRPDDASKPAAGETRPPLRARAVPAGPSPLATQLAAAQFAAAQSSAAQSPAGQPAAAGADPKAQQKVRFDSSNIKSTYCNVCNATSTREEVVINFGVNKNWDMGGPDLEVQLEHRIILSPFAAKRLQDLLVRLIAEHEQRHGKLS
jgi:Protein of unknown function (DUF3467)